MQAEISLTVREDVVSADSGWWYPERNASDGTLFGTFESNINVLIEMKSGMTGFGSRMKSERCRICPVDACRDSEKDTETDKHGTIRITD